MESQEQRDGWTLKNNVMGCQAELREEKFTTKRSRDWAQPASTKTKDIEYHLLHSM